MIWTINNNVAPEIAHLQKNIEVLENLALFFAREGWGVDSMLTPFLWSSSLPSDEKVTGHSENLYLQHCCTSYLLSFCKIFKIIIAASILFGTNWTWKGEFILKDNFSKKRTYTFDLPILPVIVKNMKLHYGMCHNCTNCHHDFTNCSVCIKYE